METSDGRKRAGRASQGSAEAACGRMAGANHLAMKSAIEMGRAMLDAANAEVRAAIEALQTLRESGTRAELMARRWQVAARAAQRHADDTNRVVAIWAQQVEDGLAALQSAPEPTAR